MKAGKECATVPEEGRRGAQMGYQKKTHSLERTHVLDSKVTLTHHERNDAGREREEELVKLTLLQVKGMGSFPVVLLLCSFQALTAVAQAQQTESPDPPGGLPNDCREEMYPCTRMYSVHKPIKRHIAELCRELSGWPRRIERSIYRKRCRNRRGNPKTWANKA
ncbi:hypothetical protein F7725_018357 [Dissostichus mawsoni]|uniref:Uncharacterized protein n=1 Tax=Dissostichus mawsoni TaxID=36200 RepID=A0A7J5XRD3_DISMA|nr:hypothetical protein F7725_018357 [Dissostichus mawsoni]